MGSEMKDAKDGNYFGESSFGFRFDREGRKDP